MRNIILFALTFQIYPLCLYGLVKLVNPSPKAIGVLGIFAIAQVVLVSLIFTWRRKAGVEVHDEREAIVQLKVRAFMLNVVTAVGVVSIFLNVGIFHDMPTWLSMGNLIITMLVAELVGYRIYHKL